MWYITEINYESYVLGSTFFATGGGLPPDEHRAMFRTLLSRVPSIPVSVCSEFDERAFFASVYGVGDPSQVTGSFDVLVKHAVTQYERLTGTRIAGLIPGEIGAEALACEAGIALDIPVVDSDLVGGRAAPEVSMDVFTVRGLPIAPVVVMDTDGSTLAINEPMRGDEIEERARTFLASHSSNGVLVGYGITAGQYAQVGMLGTLSRTFSVGTALQGGDLRAALDLCGGVIYARERLLACELKSRGGFLCGAVHFDTHTIRIKNENISLIKDTTTVVRAPDCIIVTAGEGKPIHNAEIQKHVGEELCIITIPAFGYWQEERACALWDLALV